MKKFTFSSLSKSSSLVFQEARKSPVELTKYGKRIFVILPADDYYRLARRTFTAADSRNELSAQRPSGKRL